MSKTTKAEPKKKSKTAPKVPEQPIPQPAPVLPGDPIVVPEDPAVPTHPHDPIEPDPKEPKTPTIPEKGPALS